MRRRWCNEVYFFAKRRKKNVLMDGHKRK